jgi:predicted NBD/HSP70 family sugar kinase
MMKKATRQELKTHNTRLVLRTIDAAVETSRAEIARLTGLTRPTISALVSELMERALVVETGQGPSAGGRRPTLLRIAHEAHQLLCLDLSEQEFRGAVVNLRGDVIKHRVRPAVGKKDGPDAALDQLIRLIDDLMSLATAPVLGIGIGAPGLIDAQQGVISQAVNLGWEELSLGALLEARYRRPVHIANDCHTAALGERRFGEWQNIANLLVIKAGRGIGAGIILNGRLFLGDGNGAGEIGHMRLVEAGELCRCGQVGCLETLASSRALIRRARGLAAADASSLLNQLATSPDQISGEVLRQAFQAGDAAAARVIAEAAQHLGRAISFMVSVLNIDHVVLAGSLARYGSAVIQPVQELIATGALPAIAQKTRVHVSPLAEDIVILGAAAHVLNRELGLV